MRNRLALRKWILRFWLPAGVLPALGGCLSDQQVTAIIQSVITTGLTTIVSQVIQGFLTAGAATA